MNKLNSRQTNPLLEFFCTEAQGTMHTLREKLSVLRKNPVNQSELKNSDNAVSSLKGAAKIASLNQVFELAKAMQKIINAASNNKIVLNNNTIDTLDTAIVLILELVHAADNDLEAWLKKNRKNFTDNMAKIFELQNIDETKTNTQKSASKKKTTKKNKQASTKIMDKPKNSEFLADYSMLELFRIEAETQLKKLSDGLLALENNPNIPELLEELMRAAHSVKGAARMVGIESLVTLSHLMEDIFVAAQNKKLILELEDIDILLTSADMLGELAIATADDYQKWIEKNSNDLNEVESTLLCILDNKPRKKFSVDVNKKIIEPQYSKKITVTEKTSKDNNRQSLIIDNIVRVSAESLNRLQGLAGEALVESRWLASYSDSLLQIKKRQAELVNILDHLREQLFDIRVSEVISEMIQSVHIKANECRDLLSNSLVDLESYDRRSNSLSLRLHRDVLQARMRPFSDAVQGYQRLVRDLARSLGKNVKLDIRGLDTQVDRDILDKLQSPLNHMIRNAVDHGIEEPEHRLAAGKPAHGTIRLEAMHNAGMLSIIVADDGRGIDLDNVTKKIVAKNMVTEKMASKLSETELLDFMFLPNFSTRDNVTEISGRGVGLNVVHKVVQELRGQIRSSTEYTKGTKFQFQLPLTLSVVRALVVDIAGEPYAFPLARIDQICKISKESIETMEGRQYFIFGNQHIGLISAYQILEKKSQTIVENEISIVILSDHSNKFGIIVDKFWGERNLVVHTLDSRLGKIQDISSASLTEQGEPLLILDIDDLFRSIDLVLSGGRLDTISQQKNDNATITQSKRVLIVDDSITVREVEKNLLQSKGYLVEVAVDGMDGWNAVRTNTYDLIVSDIDMPRMNGFEFVSMLKADEHLKTIPIIIVSYKDREQDRLRGLEVGADYYLTKGSFHDDTLVSAVIDLIGEP